MQAMSTIPTKNEIRDLLLSIAEISKSRADKIADRLKRMQAQNDREANLEFLRVIQYSDPTGEQAVNNVLRSLGIPTR